MRFWFGCFGCYCCEKSPPKQQCSHGSPLSPNRGLNSRRLRIASFNVRVFGKEAMSKPEVVEVLKKIIRRYDIIVIQEIRDLTNASIHQLLDIVNSHLKTGREYKMVLSPRLGRSSSKEQYAFLYRVNKVSASDTHLYNGDRFEREPFAVKFSTEYADFSMDDFVVIGCHIKPRDAAKEMSSLIEVYEEVCKSMKTENVIIMGDFNAGCRYIHQKQWENQPLRKDPRFKWLIHDGVDTTVGKTVCAYDRVIVAGKNLIDHVVPRSAIAFQFDRVFKLTEDEALAVSDHYPVEIQIQ